jgi:triphosphoribosyl-dephospho-CoA synthase
MNNDEKARHIAKCLQLAVLLEASANKPGNVNRANGFEGTRYEHFLASAVAIVSSFETAAKHGILVSDGNRSINEVELGVIIRDCVSNINTWQHGGNTLLGTSILLSPLAVSAGMAQTKDGTFEISELRENLKLVTESTTPEDAVKVYEAIRTANPGGLGKAANLDVNDPASAAKIRRENVSLFQVFKLAASYDMICSEWVNNYPITFDLAYPSLLKQLERGNELEKTIISTFLCVLAEHPDTLIARKTSTKKAREISSMTREILKLGIETSAGKEYLDRFDEKLRQSGNLLNPGTTADIIAAALALCVLGGYRP